MPHRFDLEATVKSDERVPVSPEMPKLHTAMFFRLSLNSAIWGSTGGSVYLTFEEVFGSSATTRPVTRGSCDVKLEIVSREPMHFPPPKTSIQSQTAGPSMQAPSYIDTNHWPEFVGTPSSEGTNSPEAESAYSIATFYVAA